PPLLAIPVIPASLPILALLRLLAAPAPPTRAPTSLHLQPSLPPLHSLAPTWARQTQLAPAVLSASYPAAPPQEHPTAARDLPLPPPAPGQGACPAARNQHRV